MRVTSEFWVGALLRRAQSAGAFVTVVHKGAKEAGAIYILINNLAQSFSLLGPAPQIVYDEKDDAERQFEWLLKATNETEAAEKITRERNFDPDIWLIEIEDREGRCFIEKVVEA